MNDLRIVIVKHDDVWHAFLTTEDYLQTIIKNVKAKCVNYDYVRVYNPEYTRIKDVMHLCKRNPKGMLFITQKGIEDFKSTWKLAYFCDYFQN